MDLLSRQIHLFRRAGFGLVPSQLSGLTSIEDSIDKLLNPRKSYSLQSSVTLPDNWRSLSASERQILIKKAHKESVALGGKWIEEMSKTNDVLAEKMTLFWHGHFACAITNRPDFGVNLNNTMRRQALGNFRTLTKAVAREAAMLNYLNNTQNKKSSPNENFARELMELFTIGRDNYTEEDIKEAARAFTGWGHYPTGEFVLRHNQHDYGVKTFFGKTANFGGDEIIDVLCDDKRTAQFIAGKLFKFFVADEANPQQIKELAGVLYSNDYEIKPTLKFLFTKNWFYSYAGGKIKSPTELIVGLNRAYKVKYPDSRILIFLQRSLSQHLFRPPNVAGWPGGKKWIDSSTMAFRMRLPALVLNKGIIEWNVKDEPDAMVDMKTQYREKVKQKVSGRINIDVDREEVEKIWGAISSEQYVDLHLPALRSRMAVNMIKSSRTDLASLASTVLSLPEYQLC